MSNIEKWADPAMWLAEPQKSQYPTATLIHMTDRPLQVMAAAAELYQGRVIRNVDEIRPDTALRWFREMSLTKLSAPMEFVDFHFLLEGVTRAFTHQLVRQRTAVYVQESLRFAVVEDVPVGEPPSLAGLKDDDPLKVVWTDTAETIRVAYNRLVAAGMPAEDARGLLPTNTLTRVHYKTNLRNLVDHAGNRLCTQAQFEWRLVWAQMIKAIREYGQWPPSQHWQYEAIAELFRPVCFQIGRCAFKGTADRYCSIRSRVDAHEAHGTSSARWEDIHTWEWLADPTAARPPTGQDEDSR
jgi:flavin-dependent thymidylate synthase